MTTAGPILPAAAIQIEQLTLMTITGTGDMQIRKILLAVVPALVLGACDDDGVSGPGNTGPTAAVRFMNLVRDTGAVNFRFVDDVENLPSFLGVGVRGTSGVYQGVRSGSGRPARLFPNATNVALAKVMLKDTTLNIAANNRYTFVYAGRAGTGEDVLAVFEDPATLPAPGADIAIKVLHGAHGLGAVDVYVVPVDSAAAATPANWQTVHETKIENVSYLTQTSYVNVSRRPTTGAVLYRFVVTAAGGSTILAASTPNLPGVRAAEGATHGHLPGVQIEGSVLTAVIAPGTVPGTRGSVGTGAAANQTPAVFLQIDKALEPVPPAQ
jgi:hypothetical protein